MTTAYVPNAAFEAELPAGQFLVADVRHMRAPFGWTALLEAGASCALQATLSAELDDAAFLDPLTNAAIASTVQDVETGPLRWMRFEHSAGATISIQICGFGEVRFIATAPPAAAAGADQANIAAGAEVNLDGSASAVAVGRIARFAWRQTVGDVVELARADSATPSFVAPSTNAAQTLTFELAVYTDGGLKATDTVDVGVLAEV